VTDWALGQFRAAYGESITKEDIFYYVYALLHHPEYRIRYAENLKRELPRVPLLENGWDVLTTAGRALAALHVGYETVREFPLGQVQNREVDFTWRVSKMKLSKEHGSITINDALTLTEIPEEVYEYKLGNRSALEWVVDQYQISKDKRTGMVSDPNRDDDPEYIARLVRKVVTVSVETVQHVQQIAKVAL
jgi:predicted helicase